MILGRKPKYRTCFEEATLEGYNFQMVKLLGNVAVWVCRGYVCLEICCFSLPENHRWCPETLLEVGLKDRQILGSG